MASMPSGIGKDMDSYPAYRPSDVEWLGEVPEHWGVARLCDVAKLLNGFPFDSDLFDPAEGRSPSGSATTPICLLPLTASEASRTWLYGSQFATRREIARFRLEHRAYVVMDEGLST